MTRGITMIMMRRRRRMMKMMKMSEPSFIVLQSQHSILASFGGVKSLRREVSS